MCLVLWDSSIWLCGPWKYFAAPRFSPVCSSFAQKALGSEIMVPRALALELGDALRGGRALPPPDTYSSPQ